MLKVKYNVHMYCESSQIPLPLLLCVFKKNNIGCGCPRFLSLSVFLQISRKSDISLHK